MAEVLRQSEQKLTAPQQYRRAGLDLEKLVALVAEILAVDRGTVRAAGRQPERVRARGLLCYWAVRELGITATALARELGLTQPAVTQSVQRGEKLAAERGWRLRELIGSL